MIKPSKVVFISDELEDNSQSSEVRVFFPSKTEAAHSFQRWKKW